MSSILSEQDRRKIEANIFPYARPAVSDWSDFKWHRNRFGATDGGEPHSSQALAIDVFGSLKIAPQGERDAILNQVAELAGLPSSTDWQIELEWIDPKNRLIETQARTQIDAIARSSKNLLLFECKFTEEGGGPCSQTGLIREGAHIGKRQCDGTYRSQTNPVNGKTSRCALSGKGIRYWDVIQKVFDYDAQVDHTDTACPFKGQEFQWMRNVVLGWQVSQDEGLNSAFVITFADSSRLPFPKYLNDSNWKEFLLSLKPEVRVSTLSYQRLLELAQTVPATGSMSPSWKSLGDWLEAKVRLAEGKRQGSLTSAG